MPLFYTRHFLLRLRTLDTVDLVILAKFYFSQISRGGQIRKLKNLAKIIIIIAPLNKNKNSQILNFVKSPKIKNSRTIKHAKFTRSTVYKNITQIILDIL